MKQSIVFFGIARGGSSIIGRLLQVLAESSGMRLRDIDGESYDNGVYVDDVESDTFEEVESHGVFIGPFRTAPLNFSFQKISSLRPVFLFRDPRDCLVSRYFAFLNVHSKFEEGKRIEEMKRGSNIHQDIDSYVLDSVDEIAEVFRRYKDISSRLSGPNCYKYEDIVINPIGWIKSVIHDLDFTPSSSAVTQCVIEAAFTRVSEDQREHNRIGRPGGFSEKLKADTIAELNERLSWVLEWLQYPFAYDMGEADLVDEAMQNLRFELDEIKRAVLALQIQNGYRINEVEHIRSILHSI